MLHGKIPNPRPTCCFARLWGEVFQKCRPTQGICIGHTAIPHRQHEQPRDFAPKFKERVVRHVRQVQHGFSSGQIIHHLARQLIRRGVSDINQYVHALHGSLRFRT